METGNRRREALRAAYDALNERRNEDGPALDSRVEPTDVAAGDRLVAVFADQSIRGAGGSRRRTRVAHLWSFDGELARRMEVFDQPEHPNVTAFRTFHEAQAAYYGGGSEDAVASLLAEDAEWHVPGRNAIAGDYAGRNRVLDYFRRRRERAARTFSIDVREALGADAGVVTLAFGRAELGGCSEEWGTAGVYRIADGLVTGGWLLPIDGAAFDAIWS